MVVKTKTDEAILVKPQALVRAGRKLHLPARAKEFLEYLDEGTYFKRGFHRQDGTPEHWCMFDLPTWARELDMPKPNVHRLRDYLLSLRIIHIQIDNEGTMMIGWNLNTDEWQAPPRRGGSRVGAGRPKNQNDNAGNQIDNVSLSSEENQNDNDFFQNDNADQIKMITSKQHEDRPQKVRQAPLRNYTKKLQETRDANASRDDATAPVASEESPTAPLEEKPKKERARDPYWDALVELCGSATGRESIYGKTVKAIKEMGGTPEDIPIRAENWYRLFPTATRTITALVKHWHSLSNEAVEAELGRKAMAQATTRSQERGNNGNSRQQQKAPTRQGGFNSERHNESKERYRRLMEEAARAEPAP